MSTKMKGLFKGLRYISQIFEEDKDDEMQIGFPTDVKHVAHIGWDGPSTAVQEAPSWMKEFKSPTGFQSAPLSSPSDNRGGDPEIKWVSEDSRRSSRATDSPGRDCPDLPKASRRHHSSDSNPNDSPRKKDSSTKSRHSRRNHSKDSSEGSVKSNRQLQELGSESPSRGLPPDASRKSRRKKSKESENGGGSSRSSARSRPPLNCVETENEESGSQMMFPAQSDVEGKKTGF